VTLTLYVLPDIEHCLSSCGKLAAWHIAGSGRLTCLNTEAKADATSLIQTHMQYAKNWRELLYVEKLAEIQIISTD
jgi:hypothetical protein